MKRPIDNSIGLFLFGQTPYTLSMSKIDWLEVSERIDWLKKPTVAGDYSFHKPVSIQWFADGELNVSYNCVDRHLPQHANEVALIWEPDNPAEASKKITYAELSIQVNRFANVLKKQGVKKGDRVTLYLPMIVEAVYAMLACTRIGAVHSVVFAGFSADSIANRIEDCDSNIVITADEGLRGGKKIELKKNIDEALELLSAKGKNSVSKVVVVKRTGADIAWTSQVDVWYHEESAQVSDVCAPEPMKAEDPLFILYTSGSTGKPKGVLHTTGGYLVYAAYTHEKVFGYRAGEVYWCTADVGWITGHSYIVYGPLANRATTLVFEGIPSYPDVSRFWQVIDKHQVNIFYTAPTAIRALMREGEEPVKKFSRKSLRLLGSVGEPINPEAWSWYQRVVGDGRCPVVDTWWQTETGGILISACASEDGTTYPEVLKPGAATRPLAGIYPEILDTEGKILTGAAEGLLVIKESWPGQMRTVYRDHARFEETYFSAFAGYYFTGDGCRRDADGDYWITGRVDDVLNISGHRLGTAEVESAFVSDARVSEAAVVGYPHDIKGQGIYAYITLKNGVTPTEELKAELRQHVRHVIGPIATPDIIQWAPGLPKTRSGKIMRRILRKIAENQIESLGDTSTLADPSVVKDLVENRSNK
ncbi:acetyl coenzyme A synthetase [Pseudobdellovibrio exovorus JSS]|uniref:Acetate--CoA ligase n=1 Tax=Pseudobdellovibrio exovorus JSS TaxID=1184267 RepID=M4VBI8_9BACT|nr:acetyl coenzyme A synthetase [Pseudobdellovibrio exovorus JSS]